jgi:hypothetical protein
VQAGPAVRREGRVGGERGRGTGRGGPAHATTDFDVIGRFLPVKVETQLIDGGWTATVASR